MTAFRLFKRRDTWQPSEFLNSHYLKDKYFYRLLQFRKLDGRTAVALDNKQTRLITFDPWPQTIFLNATGLKTIYQFTCEMAKTYSGTVPERLEQTIIEETENLINEGVIAVSDEKVILDPQLRYPVNNKK